jgi:integrase
MGRIDDSQRYSQRLTTELDRLDDAPIADIDRKAIRRCVEHADAVDDLADASLKQLVLYLRMASVRSETDTPLTEWELDDVNALCFTLKHDHDLVPGSVANYRKVLKRFFRFHDRDELADSFKVGAQSARSRSVDTDDILTQSEIDAMFDAASTAREQAIIALLLDMGLRLGALASLRVGDITLTDDAGFLTLNDEGNIKGAEGTLPLTWSRGYVVRWLNVHPHAADDEAALICALPSARHQGTTADGTGALTTAHIRRRLYDLAEAAGLDRKRGKPHRFRKTAVSQWVRDGLPEQDIKHRAGWTPDSQQLDTYSHVTDEEFNARVLDHCGLGSDDETSSSPTLEKCPQCESALRDGAKYCDTCRCPLVAGATEQRNEAISAIADELTDPGRTDSERRVARVVIAELQDDPRDL